MKYLLLGLFVSWALLEAMAHSMASKIIHKYELFDKHWYRFRMGFKLKYYASKLDLISDKEDKAQLQKSIRLMKLSKGLILAFFVTFALMVVLNDTSPD